MIETFIGAKVRYILQLCKIYRAKLLWIRKICFILKILIRCELEEYVIFVKYQLTLVEEDVKFYLKKDFTQIDTSLC